MAQTLPAIDETTTEHVPGFGEETSFELLASARAGDDGAIDSLLRRYLGPLQRWSRGRLPAWARDAMDTDDLVQETLLQSLDRLEHFEPRHRGAFQSYLRRAVQNRITDELRRAGRRPDDETATGLVDPQASPIERAIGRETLVRYESALARLRAKDREAVLARVELGFSYRQIAHALGKPSEDAARMAVSRALLRLAEEMASYPRTAAEASP